MIEDFKPAGRQPVNKDDASTTQKPANSPEPKFKPPEEVAADDEWINAPEPTDAKLSNAPGSQLKKHFWQKLLPKLTKKQWIIVAIVAVVLIGGSVGAYFVWFKKPAPKPAPVQAAPKVETPPPTTEASTLTGLQVPIGTNKLPVTAVMIENSPDARPQSGLLDAGVVFEAIAEGGITRFLTLFQSDSVPSYLGPIRSARPYYLDYLSGFDAAVAHVGGSPDALNQIRSQGIKDLDEFANAGAYQRITSRYAPHNVYSSMANLYNLQKSKGFSSSYSGFVRKAEKKADTPTAKSIDFAISSYLYNAHYDYDVGTNSYLRSEAGKPHIDERSNKQLNPKVVIAIIVPQGIAADRIHSTYSDLGAGQAYIFQDGIVTIGTWAKPDRKTQIKFTDANGAVIPLNPGQTWISLVGSASGVSYKP